MVGSDHARVELQGLAPLPNRLVYLPLVIEILRLHAVGLGLGLAPRFLRRGEPLRPSARYGPPRQHPQPDPEHPPPSAVLPLFWHTIPPPTTRHAACTAGFCRSRFWAGRR